MSRDTLMLNALEDIVLIASNRAVLESAVDMNNRLSKIDAIARSTLKRLEQIFDIEQNLKKQGKL